MRILLDTILALDGQTDG